MKISFLVKWAIIVLMLFLASSVPYGTRSVFAASDDPPGPDRYIVVVEKYTSYKWWLITREDNSVLCSIFIDHEGVPTGEEIFNTCGQTVYDEWMIPQSCPQDGSCDGYYLQFVKSEPAERKVGVKQPPPVVWVALDGCVSYNSTFRCDSLPTLILTGEEPLKGEQITGLTGFVGDKPFSCDPVCQVDLVPTDDSGLDLEFWAYSSYGDSSDKFQARVRVAKSVDPSDPYWYVDILSTQWRGNVLAACSEIWNKFPPVGGPPEWLSTPQHSEDLATKVSYQYLATNLIKHGVADASACDGGGLVGNGFANTCGLDAVRESVNNWQNRFDGLIFSTAQKTGVPAHLLKNIFARESQFWPGAMFDHPEAGLGQMTDGGADLVLTWNPPFFEQFCPSVLDADICRTRIYPNPEEDWQNIGLDDIERSMLRNALVHSVNATCSDCPLGIDLGKTDSSIGVFAQTLIASCSQTGKVIEMNYGSSPADAASFEDLWRFTLVNYNAGPGCLGLAVDETSNSGESLDWEHLSNHFTPACRGALEYVNAISRPVLNPTPTP